MGKPNERGKQLQMAKKAEEKQEKGVKKRAAESMTESLLPQSLGKEMAAGPSNQRRSENRSAKRSKGPSKCAADTAERLQSLSSDSQSSKDGCGQSKCMEALIREYYVQFYEGFKSLVDSCPEVEENGFESKQMAYQAASLDRFKRNMSRAATRYLLPVLEEQLQDIKGILPPSEVTALKQKYRHKVAQPSWQSTACEGSSNKAPAENPKCDIHGETKDRASCCESKEEAHQTGVPGMTHEVGDAPSAEANLKNASESNSACDRESTPDAESLLLDEIRHGARCDARPSGVHHQALAAGRSELGANDETSGEQHRIPSLGECASTQIASCLDAQGAAKLLRTVGLSRLAETTERCSISGKTVAQVLDGIPGEAFLEQDPFALLRGCRPSNGSEKSVADTVEANSSSSDERGLGEDPKQPHKAAVQPQRRGDSGMASVLHAVDHAVEDFDCADGVGESEGADSAVEPIGRCRRCSERFKLDDPKRIPRLLACCHTLCAGCVKEVADCPRCGHPVRPGDRCPEDRLEVERVLSRCDACSRGAYAVAQCLDCNKRLCHECNDAHSRAALSKEHRVRELAQAVYVPKQFCVADGHDHGPFEVYCKTCDVILCAKGFMEEHMVHNHDYSWIQQVADADRAALADHQRDLELILQYRDPRNVRRRLQGAEGDGKALEQLLDEVLALVGTLRSDLLEAFHSKTKREVGALLQLRRVAAAPARQAIRYSKAVMSAAAAHSGQAGGVVQHYVLHKTAKDALERYKESVVDTREVTSGVLQARGGLDDGSPLRLFRDRLIEISSTCSDIGNRLLTASSDGEGGEEVATPASPVLDRSPALVPSPLSGTTEA